MSQQGPNLNDYHLSSRLIHGKMSTRAWEYGHHVVPPISSSSAYRLESVERGAEGFIAYGAHPLGDEESSPIFIYDRLGEPSGMMLQSRIALAEGAEIRAVFGSGMAAISAAVMFDLKAGDHVLADATLYGCTYSLFTNWLPQYGIEVTMVNFSNLDLVRSSFKPNARVVYFETPANPSLTLYDIEQIVAITKERSSALSKEDRPCRVMVDNTFATPFCQRPISHGVDIVIHSLTKNINGFGTDTGGVVVGPRSIEQKLILWRKDFGGILSPKSAWNHLVFGLPTLELRVRAQQVSALKIATYLESHDHVEQVIYPGLPSHPQYELALRQMRDYNGEFAPSNMIYFRLVGKSTVDRQEEAVKLMNWLAKNSYCITLAVSLGQIRTLIEHPTSMTHSSVPVDKLASLGLDPEGVRMSIGIERVEDILLDLERALSAIA